jgi:hypothetical protein
MYIEIYAIIFILNLLYRPDLKAARERAGACAHARARATIMD